MWCEGGCGDEVVIRCGVGGGGDEVWCEGRSGDEVWCEGRSGDKIHVYF